jgi:hypothetical protein
MRMPRARASRENVTVGRGLRAARVTPCDERVIRHVVQLDDRDSAWRVVMEKFLILGNARIAFIAGDTVRVRGTFERKRPYG